jgi:hypothetical protein
MRVRWLHGSAGAEKSVMMERLLDTIPLPRSSQHWASLTLPSPLPPYLTSFQNSRFRSQASQVKTSRNRMTQTPIARRIAR